MFDDFVNLWWYIACNTVKYSNFWFQTNLFYYPPASQWRTSLGVTARYRSSLAHTLLSGVSWTQIEVFMLIANPVCFPFAVFRVMGCHQFIIQKSSVWDVTSPAPICPLSPGFFDTILQSRSLALLGFFGARRLCWTISFWNPWKCFLGEDHRNELCCPQRCEWKSSVLQFWNADSIIHNSDIHVVRACAFSFLFFRGL